MGERSPVSRRLHAAYLFARGQTQAQVARKLGVTRTTAMRWHRAWCADGRSGLARSALAGRPRKLEGSELSAVLASLPRGTSVARAAELIEERTGVHYHPGHVWRILKAWGWADRFDPGPVAHLRDPDGHGLFLYEELGPARE